MAVPEYTIEGLLSIDCIFLGCTLRVGVILIFKKVREQEYVSLFKIKVRSGEVLF